MDRHYGKYPVTKIIKNVDLLRKAIRAEGTQRVQDAWDEIEPVIDFFLRRSDDNPEQGG